MGDRKKEGRLVSYRVEFHPDAEKSFLSLPGKIQRRIAALIDGLVENPHPAGCRKITGTKYKDLYRLRAGDYRVVYQVRGKVLLVFVLRIGKRDQIYKGIARGGKK